MKSESISSFGPWFRRKRKARGLTQTEIAQATGLHKITISNIENGKSGVSRDSVSKLALSVGAEEKEALLKAGLGREDTIRPDVEFSHLAEGLTEAQRRVVYNVAKAAKDSLLAPAG